MKNTTFLYVLKAGDYFKVGITQNLSKRIKQIQTGCPLKISRVYYYVLDTKQEALELEKEIHTFLSKISTSGEWFLMQDGFFYDIESFVKVKYKDLTKFFNIYYESDNKREMISDLFNRVKNDKSITYEEKINILTKIRNDIVNDKFNNDLFLIIEKSIKKYINILATINIKDSKYEQICKEVMQTKNKRKINKDKIFKNNISHQDKKHNIILLNKDRSVKIKKVMDKYSFLFNKGDI